jgi:hypothetical protein
LAVGNTDLAGVDDRTGYFSLKSTPFVYRMADGQQMPIRFPGNDADDSDLVTHTAYGIWYNGGGKYTIAGGAGAVLQTGQGVVAGAGYLLDYDSVTGLFSNYTEFSYKNRDKTDIITHFEGIYRDASGDYWMPATSVGPSLGDPEIASVVKVERGRSGLFESEANWYRARVVNNDTGATSVVTTANSLFGDVLIGLANYPGADNQLVGAGYVNQVGLWPWNVF